MTIKELYEWAKALRRTNMKMIYVSHPSISGNEVENVVVLCK